MPRPNLRHSQSLIREFCLQRGLPYAETSLGRSYVQALRHLNAVASGPASSQHPPAGQPGSTPTAAPAATADAAQT